MRHKPVTSENLEDCIEKSDRLKRLFERLETPLSKFRPRPDIPEEYDEQTSFMGSQHKCSILLGGTGSGKTISAAVKTAQYVYDNPPPRSGCPFWIVGETYDVVCQVPWLEKLSTLISRESILAIDWYKEKRRWPFAVILRHPDNIDQPGWILEFKSYAQGRQKMQSASIGGYWCNEEIPLEILQEIHGRCRDYDSPGWCDFTPIGLRCPAWIDIYDDVPEGWKFFHLNVEKNTSLPEGWAARYLRSIPEDMRETRRIGTFTTFSGAVYKEFHAKTHIVNALDPTEQQARAMPWLDPLLMDFGLPPSWHRVRAIDWGYNNPFCCLWIAKDPDGRYYVYDQHYESQQLLEYHAKKIKERYWNTGDKVTYRYTYADPSDRQCRAEFSRLGIPTRGAVNNLLAGIEIVRKHLMVQGDGRPMLYILTTREGGQWTRCTHLIKELRSYHWQSSTAGGNAKEAPVAKDDHSIDSLRYALATEARAGSSEIQRIALKKRDWQGSGSFSATRYGLT